MAVQVEEQTGRDRVLGAAAELFVAQGYNGTTLRQIAAAAGIKAGSVYHHFDSKESLFVAVLSDGMAVMISAFDSVTGQAAGEAPELQAHVHAHLSAVFEHGPYTTAHVTSFYSAPAAVRDQVVPLRDNYENKWHDLFTQLFPDGKAKELRLRRLLLFGAMNATVEWFDLHGDVSLDQLASTIADQFLHGVTQ